MVHMTDRLNGHTRRTSVFMCPINDPLPPNPLKFQRFVASVPKMLFMGRDDRLYTMFKIVYNPRECIQKFVLMNWGGVSACTGRPNPEEAGSVCRMCAPLCPIM